MTQRKGGLKNSKSASSHSKGELKFTRPVAQPGEIIRAGEEAATLLNSPIYNLAINSIVEDLGIQMLETEPHENQKRQWLYDQGAAVQRINQKLAIMVHEAQKLNQDEVAREEAAQREQAANRGFASAPMD